MFLRRTPIIVIAVFKGVPPPGPPGPAEPCPFFLRNNSRLTRLITCCTCRQNASLDPAALVGSCLPPPRLCKLGDADTGSVTMWALPDNSGAKSMNEHALQVRPRIQGFQEERDSG